MLKLAPTRLRVPAAGCTGRKLAGTARRLHLVAHTPVHPAAARLFPRCLPPASSVRPLPSLSALSLLPVRHHRAHPHAHDKAAHPRTPSPSPAQNPQPNPQPPPTSTVKLSAFVDAVKRLSFDASQNMVLCCCRDDINDHMLAEFEQAFNIFNLQSLGALPSQGTVSYNVAGDHFKGDYIVVILPHYSSAPGTNRCGAILTAMDKLKLEKKKLAELQERMHETSDQQEMSAVQLLSNKFPYSAELGLLVEICKRVDTDLCHIKVDGDTQKRVCQFIVNRHLAALSNLPRHKPKRVITGILNHHHNTVEDFCDNVAVAPNQPMEVVDVLCEF